MDRAALDFAIQHGYEHGGWCPRGHLAEDGVIPPIYQLRETDSADYDERTEKNVVDSDATLIVAREKELSGGTAFTKTCAEQHGRPVLVVCERDGVSPGAAVVSEFLKQNSVRTLNVAGPRESQAPGIGKFVMELLEAALTAFGARSRTRSRTRTRLRCATTRQARTIYRRRRDEERRPTSRLARSASVSSGRCRASQGARNSMACDGQNSWQQ